MFVATKEKKITELACQFKNEDIRKRNLSVGNEMRKMVNRAVGETNARDYLDDPRAIVSTGKESQSKWERAIWFETEIARSIGGDEIDADKFDEIIRNEVYKPSWTTAKWSVLPHDIAKAKYYVQEGRYIRNTAISNSDPVAIARTKEGMLGGHKAFFSDGAVKSWNSICAENGGVPANGVGKVKDNAVELRSIAPSTAVAPPTTEEVVAPCAEGAGVEKIFAGRKVCEIRDLDAVSECAVDENLRIFSCKVNGIDIEVNPQTLNDLIQQKRFQRETCEGNICRYET